MIVFPLSVTRAPAGSDPIDTVPLSVFGTAATGGGVAGGVAGTTTFVGGSCVASGAPCFESEKMNSPPPIRSSALTTAMGMIGARFLTLGASSSSARSSGTITLGGVGLFAEGCGERAEGAAARDGGAVAACKTEVGDAYVAPSDATSGLITCVTPSAYDSLPSLSCSRVSRSATSRPLLSSRAKYTTPPPSERSISPSTSYSPSAAPFTALSSSSGDASPERVPERSFPQLLQKRPQPTRSTLHDGHLLPMAGTEASSSRTTLSSNSPPSGRSLSATSFWDARSRERYTTLPRSPRPISPNISYSAAAASFTARSNSSSPWPPGDPVSRADPVCRSIASPADKS